MQTGRFNYPQIKQKVVEGKLYYVIKHKITSMRYRDLNGKINLMVFSFDMESQNYIIFFLFSIKILFLSKSFAYKKNVLTNFNFLRTLLI